MADLKMQSEASDSNPQVENQRKESPAAAAAAATEVNHRRASPAPAPAQQWVAMRYPPAAAVMPHQMMFAAAAAAPYSPYHQYQPHHYQSRGNKHFNGSNGENKTIWIGDLHHWMDENYLNSCFASAGEISSVKVIRNKHTGLSEGYGFVEFLSHEIAEKVLQNYNGVAMPNAVDQTFRLNWASFSTGEKRLESGPDLSIFVGDLAPDVTDKLLHETFSVKYPSVKAAKVVIDVNTGRSKGYGFVRFGDDNERAKAITEMNGVNCSNRAMRIGPATPRKSNGYQQGGYTLNGAQGHPDGDSLNTTIFVGGLDPNVTDEDLRQPFADYGDIVSVKIPTGKGCGFVQFVNRTSAEEALDKLNGVVIGKQTVRLSWGRSPANKQVRGEFGNQWVGPYYGGQYYNGYGYMIPPPHDPIMYTAAPYGAYPMYGGDQQQVS
ncbi:PREDICTED: polyadenylate-binding protein RBP47C-like [Tarenaya hassleriana]|uniref:polyadenylate-binding protein RBP47C-like n=1 Tax=Tarenaya hassleriana TaxID=28532 RepID=UPI00053C14F1|nr:PREDICTED: polyadenylate-binding protein RBP47C-like [Tarenaya hassleriana]